MKKYITVLLIISTVLSGCNNAINTDTEEVKEKAFFEEEIDIKENEKGYLVDEDAEMLFKEVYLLDSLEKHEVYRVDDTIHTVFYLNENVKKQEIINVKEYVIKLFVMKSQMKMTPMPYQNEALYSDLEWENVNHRIYINNDRVLRAVYNDVKENKMPSEYYENMDIVLDTRLIDTSITQEFTEKIYDEYNSIHNIFFEKAIKGNVLVIKLKGSNELEEKDIDYLKNIIESQLIPKLERESVSKYSMNMDYLGVVLQLYSNNIKYFEETYFNLKEKSWNKEDWMNYDFYLNYINN